MCTVTYLPTSEGFILTQNRDESTDRPSAQFPVQQSRNNHQLLFPRDPTGGGTWLAASSQPKIVSLMNGAFVNHERKPPYRMSRGQVVLDAFAYAEAEAFAEKYQFGGIEPFTLLWFTLDKIEELRWNGERYFLANYTNDQPHIWSSVTLYDPDAEVIRDGWFERWLEKNPELDESDVLEFHQQRRKGEEHISVNMCREGLQTVSISKVVVSAKSIGFTYLDLLNKQTCHEKITKQDATKIMG